MCPSPDDSIPRPYPNRYKYSLLDLWSSLTGQNVESTVLSTRCTNDHFCRRGYRLVDETRAVIQAQVVEHITNTPGLTAVASLFKAERVTACSGQKEANVDRASRTGTGDRTCAGVAQGQAHHSNTNEHHRTRHADSPDSGRSDRKSSEVTLVGRSRARLVQ